MRAVARTRPARARRPDAAGGLLLILVVGGPDRGHLLPEPVALLALGVPRPDVSPLAADLDVGLGTLEVQVPGRMPGIAALGADHDEVVALAAVEQRRRPALARFPARTVSSRTGAWPILPPSLPPLRR
jgi:hypothetical protein